MLRLGDRRRLPRRLARPCPHFRLRACPARACASCAWSSSAPAPPAGPHEAWPSTSTVQFPHRPPKNVVSPGPTFAQARRQPRSPFLGEDPGEPRGRGKLRGRKLSQLETPMAGLLAESRRRGRGARALDVVPFAPGYDSGSSVTRVLRLPTRLGLGHQDPALVARLGCYGNGTAGLWEALRICRLTSVLLLFVGVFG